VYFSQRENYNFLPSKISLRSFKDIHLFQMNLSSFNMCNIKTPNKVLLLFQVDRCLLCNPW
jgi:hypothetical protein